MAEGTRKHVEVAIAIVYDPTAHTLLICRRKADTVLGGFWEFPGGKCNPGETPEACTVREVLEETGLHIKLRSPLTIITHDYPHAQVRLHPFLCEHTGGELRVMSAAEGKWVPPTALPEYQFPEANSELVRALATGIAHLWLQSPQR